MSEDKLVILAWGEYGVCYDYFSKAPDCECPSCCIDLSNAEIVGFHPDPPNKSQSAYTPCAVVVVCPKKHHFKWMHCAHPSEWSENRLKYWPEQLRGDDAKMAEVEAKIAKIIAVERSAFIVEKRKLTMRANMILKALYEPGYIFMKRINEFHPPDIVEAKFKVPSTEQLRYTKTPLEYVSSIERHMCINQLAYVLVGLLVAGQHGDFAKISPSMFAEAELSFRMWSVDEHFRHREILPKDKEFKIKMYLSYSRVSPKRLSLVQVEFDGAVSGEVKFAAKFNAN